MKITPPAGAEKQKKLEKEPAFFGNFFFLVSSKALSSLASICFLFDPSWILEEIVGVGSVKLQTLAKFGILSAGLSCFDGNMREVKEEFLWKLGLI